MNKTSLLRFGLAMLAVVLLPSNAKGATFTINDVSGGYSASAIFTSVGSNLVVTLTNTGVGDVWDPAHVLTGVFFDIVGDPTLTPLSATICATCSVTNGGTTGPNNSVNGEWAYRNASALAFGANYGISSTGLGLFGPTDVFGVPNLSGPGSPAGAEYGITQIGDNPSTNGGLSGVPLITNQVIFTLAGLPSSFNVNALGAISNITFQYGTSLSEARSIPEPGSLVLLAAGGALLTAVRWRRKK